MGDMERGDRSEEEDEDTQSSGLGGGGDDSGGPRETPLPPGHGGGEGSGSEEEGDTSDSGSTNSSTSSSGSSSSSGMAAGSPGEETYSGTLMQTDEFGDHFHVNCAGNAAKFYLNRFARGSIGRCVLFRSRWITPNEFQAISGRQSSKDWKRSIRLRGRCLKEYIAQGLFQEHLKTCACRICSGEAAEHLRLEGEMALAAKRRRLSQADGGSVISGQSSTYGDVVVLQQDAAHSPTHMGVVTAVKRRKGRGGRVHRVWSPSGEVAQDLSDDEEGEEGERGFVIGEVGEDEGREKRRSPTEPVGEPVGELRRRSQRCVDRRHTGHRTELGTFSRRPREWDVEEVGEFLKAQGFGQHYQQFMEEGVDGESLFLLREAHLVETFGLKLGPALKLLYTISCLRHPPV